MCIKEMLLQEGKEAEKMGGCVGCQEEGRRDGKGRGIPWWGTEELVVERERGRAIGSARGSKGEKWI